MPVKIDPVKLEHLLSRYDDSDEPIAAARLDRGAVFNWLKGVGSPSLDQARRLARVMGVPVDSFAEVID